MEMDRLGSGVIRSVGVGVVIGGGNLYKERRSRTFGKGVGKVGTLLITSQGGIDWGWGVLCRGGGAIDWEEES